MINHYVITLSGFIVSVPDRRERRGQRLDIVEGILGKELRHESARIRDLVRREDVWVELLEVFVIKRPCAILA